MLDPIDRQLGDPSVHWLLRPLLVFVGVGLLEELCKFAWLALAARADRALDEPFDWVVYSVSVSLGFAALENVRVLWQGAGAGWTRALFAVPAARAGRARSWATTCARAMRDGPATAVKRRWLCRARSPRCGTRSTTTSSSRCARRAGQPWGRVPVLLRSSGGAVDAGRAPHRATLWRSEQGLPPPILAPAQTLARLVGVRFGDGRGERSKAATRASHRLL